MQAKSLLSALAMALLAAGASAQAVRTERNGSLELANQIAAGAVAACSANGYNLAVSSYVEAEDTREVVDIAELNAEIARIVTRQAELRAEVDAIVADLEKP